MVDQIRFFAGAARHLEGRSAGEYMAGHTSFIRREPIGVCGEVTPWNYPMMMAVWKFAPGPGRGQHHGAQAVGHHAGHDGADGRDHGRVPPARRVQRGVRRPGHRPGAGRAPDPRHGVGHRLGAGRHGGGRRRPPTTSSGCTSSSAARRRSSSSTTPTSARRPRASPSAGYFNAGQDCTAATRVLAGPRVARRPRRALVEQAERHDGRRHRQRRTPTSARSTTPTSSTGSRGFLDRTPGARQRGRPAGTGWATAATASRRPWSPGCARTTR